MTSTFDPHSPDADPTRPVNTKTEINSQVVLVEYDPAWPTLYRHEEARIRAALGDRALAVEHFGSTSVPGLIAKPCIDIILVVAETGDEAEYVRDLQSAGYVLRISEVLDTGEVHQVFNGGEINLNLHVHPQGSMYIASQLDFRDWLRAHPEDAERYANAKLELAGRTWRYMQEYADAKDDIVREITARMHEARAADAR